MEAIKFNVMCNKCDDSAYESAQSITDRLNQKLGEYDPHSKARLSVHGQLTGRFIKLVTHGETEEALEAVENVFRAEGYLTLIEQDGDEATIYIVFDANVAPGPDEEARVREEWEESDITPEPAGEAESEGLPQGTVTGTAEEAIVSDGEGDGTPSEEESDGESAGTGFYPG